MTQASVSHYRLLTQIGCGGMGIVYRAIDTRLDRQVAVKFLSKTLATDPKSIERFKREARTASSLDHPNICGVYDVGELDGQPYIVMPLLRGQSLKECIARDRLTIVDVIEYGIRIADALASAHARGILHRDVKPANIFVTERNEPVLLDFGLAKLAAAKHGAASRTETSRSTTSTVGRLTGQESIRFGTPAYSSPEQALGAELDPRSDVYSFGVTLYEMATGRLPFNGPTSAAILNEIMTGTPTAPSSIRADLPPDFDRLIYKALDRDQSLRYQTVTDMQADLKRLRRGSPERSDTGTASASARWADMRTSSTSLRPVFPTEAINPASLNLDHAATTDVIDIIANEDRQVVTAVHLEKERIAAGVEIVTAALRNGGRLIFVGAGTSGRLGVLEAAEMPPTFGTSPRLVQAVMAGGHDALFSAKEAVEVEDDYGAGARSVSRLRVSKRDVVVGLSAGGKTPFVRGALARSGKAGAKTIFITCWPGSELQASVDLTIAPVVGPEIIAGSTRLKAGTATKMVLNMLTTISMVRLGKTYGNLMVDVLPASEKLKDRACRIVCMVTGVNYNDAGELMRRARWSVKVAIVMHKKALNYADALSRLNNARGSVRDATGEDAGTRLRELLATDTAVRVQEG